MKNIAVALMGVFLVQGFVFTGAAMADDDDFHDAVRHERSAHKNEVKAAEARAEARAQARHGHGFKSKLSKIKSKIYKSKAKEERQEAREDMHDALHDD
jgi:hypothetical protein